MQRDSLSVFFFIDFLFCIMQLQYCQITNDFFCDHILKIFFFYVINGTYGTCIVNGIKVCIYVWVCFVECAPKSGT